MYNVTGGAPHCIVVFVAAMVRVAEGLVTCIVLDIKKQAEVDTLQL
jgi:hypothetical protein